MIKLVPLLISFCLFCCFLSLIAMNKKKIVFTLFRGRFLSSSVERATYFREKVCFCFPFRFLREITLDKKTLFTLLKRRFLSWSAERATRFREKVCFCFPFRFLRQRSTVLGSLAGTSTLTKRHGCHFHVSPAVEITLQSSLYIWIYN